MTSHIDIKRGLRLLIVISLLAFAHKGMAVEYMYTGEGGGGGVPPATAAPTPATTSDSSIPPASSSSVPKLDADPYCNNNPCLKVPEPISYRPEEKSLGGDVKGIIEYGKGAVVEKVLPTIIKVVTNPVEWVATEGSEAIVKQGLKGAAGLGVGVFFAPSEIGDGTLPPELQQSNAKNAAENTDRQKRIDFFNNLQQSNIEEMKKAEAEATKQKFEAAKQQYEAQQASRSVFDLASSYLNATVQMQQMKQQTSAPVGSAYSGSSACPPGHSAVGNYCMPPAGCVFGVNKNNPHCR